MEAVRKIIENAQESISIEIPESMRNQKLEVIILPAAEHLEQNEEPFNTTPEKKDLSSYFGKLQWEGDAVAEQRKLRDEWD